MSDIARKPAPACMLLYIMVICGAVYASSASTSQDAHPAQERSSPKPESSAVPQEKPSEKHSTPEDYQRLVTIARKLEAAPLDPALAPDRQWAVSFVLGAPDIHVRICTNLLADLRRPRYKYRSEIGEQLLISSAAFLIEHPDQTNDSPAQSVGGMEGVLKAYSAIIKAEPQATAKSLDALLEKQREGKLADGVGEIMKGCQADQKSSARISRINANINKRLIRTFCVS